MTRRFAARCLAGGALVLVAVFTVVGCGKASKKTGTVTGTVTYKGNPVKSGLVNFLSATGAASQGQIDASGNYKLDAPIEEGEYKVYLQPPIPGQAGPPDKKAVPPPKFEVPEKFQDMAKSGVKVTVKPGENTIPIELKD